MVLFVAIEPGGEYEGRLSSRSTNEAQRPGIFTRGACCKCGQQPCCALSADEWMGQQATWNLWQGERQPRHDIKPPDRPVAETSPRTYRF